uniref:Nudix hydrolase domain-containing protein n=1 Tax=viral metagenome TaxID=1070528 RepID=A0A6C0LGG5_9ZZZZ
MLTYICDTHSDYPKRISANNLFYTEYKDQRPFFFHDVLLQEHMPEWSEPLVPTIDIFKDKYSYVTNDYVLNSIYFEYCDYYIKYIEDEDINFSMLPMNPYGPTGIGGRGNYDKWGPNHDANPIVITYDPNRNIYQLLVIERKDTPGVYTLPGGMRDSGECVSTIVTQELKEETNLILDVNTSQFIYSGYVNDPRNTDHAWLETCVYLFNINESQREILLNTMSAGDDAISIKLIDIDDTNEIYKNLYANHKEFVEMSFNYI